MQRGEELTCERAQAVDVVATRSMLPHLESTERYLESMYWIEPHLVKWVVWFQRNLPVRSNQSQSRCDDQSSDGARKCTWCRYSEYKTGTFPDTCRIFSDNNWPSKTYECSVQFIDYVRNQEHCKEQCPQVLQWNSLRKDGWPGFGGMER